MCRCGPDLYHMFFFITNIAVPVTTTIAPRKLSQVILSEDTKLGCRDTANSINPSVSRGIIANTALTLEASQCSSASAKQPYASTVFAPQKASRSIPVRSRANNLPGAAIGRNNIEPKIKISNKTCCELNRFNSCFWAKA